MEIVDFQESDVFMKKISAVLAMTAATVLWGLAFSAQSKGMEHVSALLFVALRSIVGAAALAAVIMFADAVRYRKCSFWGDVQSWDARQKILSGGIFCGLIIAGASTFQQLGLLYVSAGKTGFLTALYIIMVPLLGILFRRKTNAVLYLAVLLALAGSYLLCGGIAAVKFGELCVLICAFLFAVHILVIDRYASSCDCLRLSCLQFAVAAAASAVISIILREPWITHHIVESLPFWIFCGIGSSAIAFTLQIAAQKYLHPVTAALIMSLESVFAVLGGWLFLNERLSGKEAAGCLVILLAVALAQIPVSDRKKSSIE